MTKRVKNSFWARAVFETAGGQAYLYRLDKLEKDGLGSIDRLPFSIKILLEALLRECDGYVRRRSAQPARGQPGSVFAVVRVCRRYDHEPCGIAPERAIPCPMRGLRTGW